jgi:hypothetical protein
MQISEVIAYSDAVGTPTSGNFLLENSFKSSNLPLHGYLKPAVVSMTTGSALWRNQAGTQIYQFGGGYNNQPDNNARNLTTPNLQVPSWPTIFGYDIPSSSWFNASIDGVGSFLPPAYGHYSSVPDSSLVYQLGGSFGNDTTPGSNVSDFASYGGIPQLGMMIADTNFAPKSVVHNETGATGLPDQGAYARGNLVYTPFGENGSLISVGGAAIALDGLDYTPVSRAEF